MAREQLDCGCLTYSNAPDLARRIESGEPADVFASASAGDPARLYAMGLFISWTGETPASPTPCTPMSCTKNRQSMRSPVG